jgi:Tat protein secretion system quality control protein TatD with DNase activity
VVQRIAELKELDEAKVMEQTTRNAMRLFGGSQ